MQSINEIGNNIDVNLNCYQYGTLLTDVLESAEWTVTPDAALVSGSFGIVLYVENITGLSATDDNKFCVVKRPYSSTDYADWITVEESTTIPLSGTSGRVFNSGSGYSQRNGFKSFSNFAMARAGVVLQEIPDLYWVGGNGSWSDASHWSTTSGGAGGAGIPTINTNVHIDGNSGIVTVTMPVGVWYTKNFIMTNAGLKSSFIGNGILLPRPNGPY